MRRLRLISSLALITVPWTGCTDDSVGGTGSGATTGDVDLTSSGGVADTIAADSTGESDESAGNTADETGDGSCTDNVANTNETDVDCGGPDCPACDPPDNCLEDSDCTTLVCDNGECQVPTCYDDVQNGVESGVDCGGNCPNVCLPGPGPCEDDLDCEDDEFCMDGECVPSDCRNGIQDSSETDVDCGGVDCPVCADDAECILERDCISGVCEDGVCQAATCSDSVQNADETDVDCGGGTCAPCPNGADCGIDADCVSGVCDAGTCVSGSCSDGVENQDETDVDCGGLVCDPCMADAECDDGDDCDSGVCLLNICQDPTCIDGVENGDETDEDCGNSCGAGTCDVGEGCDDDTDCSELICEFTVCSAPDCYDGVMNGIEVGVDCGPAAGCDLCDDGEGCQADSDCDSGVCDEVAGLCLPPACDDGIQNGDETDEDCGNMCGPTCIPGEICDDALDCTTGVCDIGLCLTASCDDGVLNGDEVDIDCAGSCPQPCSIDPEVTVNNTTVDFQTSPSLAMAPDGSFWVVTWTSSPGVGAPQDGSGSGVFARMYDDAGPMGAEFQVNTAFAGNQNFSDVAAYNDGFVVVWQADGDQDGDSTGIFGQVFDDTGTPVGAEFGVNQTTADAQRRPSVAMDAAGNFVACWDGNNLDFDAFCRRFSAAGGPLAGEVQMNASNTNNDQLPVVARDSVGNYTVVWQTSGAADGDGIGVYMRRFNAAGTQVTPVTQINTATAGNQSEPTVAIAPAGEFVVTWTSEQVDASATGIAARRYNASAVAQGGEFVVNTTTLGAQQRPAVAVAADGDFWIAWQTPFDGSTTGVFGQRYQANGTLIDSQFRVNPTSAGRQEEPDVAVRLNTEIVGVWSHGDAAFTTSDIRQVRYDGEL